MRGTVFLKYFDNLGLYTSMPDREFFSKAYLGVFGRCHRNTLIVDSELLLYQVRLLSSLIRFVLCGKYKSIMVVSSLKFVNDLSNRIFLDNGVVRTYELSYRGFINFGTRGTAEMCYGVGSKTAAIFVIGLNGGLGAININTVIAILRKISCSPIVVFDDSGPIIKDTSVYNVSASVRTEIGASFWLNLIKYFVDSYRFTV